MSKPPLVPAEINFDGDGTPRSVVYGDVYHSRHGGLKQAQHAFIAGNALPQRWQQAAGESFAVLETGFGIGLNFLATWQAWREIPHQGRLHYLATELHPFRLADMQTLLALELDEAHTELAKALLKRWPLPIGGVHRLELTDDVVLTLMFGDSTEMLAACQSGRGIDAVYLDGFAPAKNPAMWSRKLLASVTRFCHADSTLATWCVVGEVRRELKALGWSLQRVPGYATKREMLCGKYSPPAYRHAVPPAPTFAKPDEKRAIVIGAGIAGCTVSERLAARGWQIDLFDKHPAPATEASGNPIGLLLPRLAKDDAIGARAARAAYFYALRYLSNLPQANWSSCGVLQLAADATDAQYQQDCIASGLFPETFVQWLDAAQAKARLTDTFAWKPAQGGWWFADGAWVEPASVCLAAIHRAGQHLQANFSTEINRIAYADGEWSVFDERDSRLAHAPQLVLANAHAANRLLPTDLATLLDKHLPLDRVRGQISILDAATHPDLASVPVALSGNGYLTPAVNGRLCLGASFNRNDDNMTETFADHQHNLQRLEELLPGASKGIDPSHLKGRVGFRTTTPDRLPLAGPLPDPAAIIKGDPGLRNMLRAHGLHALIGLGSRGLMWAPLAAELLASRLCGEPLPMDSRLADALDPARFYLRHLRRAQNQK